eukprot:scaffold37640_cov117-Skeletonema_marinoi.AAC.1
MEAKAAGTKFDTDAFLEELREKHPDKGDAINFVAGREKHNSNVQTISDELARANKAGGIEFDTDAFLEELREKHPDKGDAINFVAGREKHNSNVQTISDELARAKKDADTSTEFDTDAFLEELREKYPDKGDAINFVAGTEKHNSDVQTIYNELAKMKAKAAGTEFDTDAFLEELRKKHPDKGSAINFVAGGEKSNSDVQTISDELARAKKAGGAEFDTDAFLEELRKKYPDKGDAINFVAGRVRACKSVLSKRKSMLTSVITSVEKAAKARSVEECKIDCSIYTCIECSEKRSEEYSEFHYAVAALGKDKLVTCLLCKEKEFISTNFRREGSISVKDVREERNKLEQQSKEEKKRKRSKSKESKSKKTKSKKSAPKLKKRKSSDQANSEGLADGNAVRSGGPDDDESCSDCSYHLSSVSTSSSWVNPQRKALCSTQCEAMSIVFLTRTILLGGITILCCSFVC